MNRAKDLRKLQALQFAVHEAVLYLDGHPKNRKALEYYTQMKKQMREAYENFVEKYGPLNAFEVEGDSWSWISQPWPWKGE